MAGYSTTTGTGNVLCPFFHAHSAREIYCEGLLRGSMTIHRFADAIRKQRTMDALCNREYTRCPMYCILMRYKYKEDQ